MEIIHVLKLQRSFKAPCGAVTQVKLGLIELWLQEAEELSFDHFHFSMSTKSHQKGLELLYGN